MQIFLEWNGGWWLFSTIAPKKEKKLAITIACETSHFLYLDPSGKKGLHPRHESAYSATGVLD
jgi:hypothetical protein